MATYKIELAVLDFVTPNLWDVSNEIIACSEIPYAMKNRDCTLLADGYTVEISDAAEVVPETDLFVYAYRDTEIIHIGYITKISRDEDNLSYKLTIAHVFDILNKMNTKDSSLNTLGSFYEDMIEESEERVTWGHTYKLISYKKLIELIIKEITGVNSFAVDWSNSRFWTDHYYAWEGWYRWDEDENDKSDFEICPATQVNDILFMPEMINNTGEPHVHDPTDLTDVSTPEQVMAVENVNANRRSLFSILSLLCSMTGLYFIPKARAAFYAVNLRQYVPGTVGAGEFLSPDDFIEINDEGVIAKDSGIKSSYDTLDPRFMLMPGAPYYLTPHNSHPTQHYGTATYSKGKNPRTLDWMNHFIPIVHKPTIS